MINLLSAHLFRMKKSSLFWGCLLISSAAGAWQSIQTFLEYGRQQSVDIIFFVYTMLIGLLLSVFLPLFFGSEYSDGTIRNKLAAGHTRLSVYLTSLTAAVLAALLFCGVCILFTMAAGVPLLGGPKYPGLLLKTTLLSLLMAAAWVFAKLDAPEFWPMYDLTVGGQISSVMEPNPAYLTPDQRPLYQFLLDLNPMGQAIQYINVAVARPIQLILCSLGTVAVTTIAGAALFQRKDLK